MVWQEFFLNVHVTTLGDPDSEYIPGWAKVANLDALDQAVWA